MGARSVPSKSVLTAAQQAAYRADMGSAWPQTDLVFTTRTGRPIEPRNLVRSFRRICDTNQLRTIKVHHLRHTVASLLKGRGVASDASFPGRREDGAVSDAGCGSPTDQSRSLT
jgi:integrase